MALANEMVLDLTETLKQAEKMDKFLASWVETSKKIEQNLTKAMSQTSEKKGKSAVSSVGTDAKESIDSVNRLTNEIQKLDKQKAPSKGNDAFSTMQKRLEELLKQLEKAKEDIELYKQAIGTGKKTYVDWGQSGLKEAEQRAKSLMAQITALENTYKNLRNSSANIGNITGNTLEGERQKRNIEQQREYYKRLEAESKRSEEKKRKDAEKTEEERYRLALARMNREQKEQQKRDEENFNRQKRNIEQQNRMYAQMAQQQAKEPKKAPLLISQQGQAKSLNELKNYVNELKKTMNSLDPKSKEWEKLNTVLTKSNNKIKGIKESMGELKSKSSNLLNISEQLTRRLALVFSVSQITGYVKKLASVCGEFELQQKSLAAIIQNKDKANEIFDKVTKLAVQSPFQLQELVTYTKQLAAYRIETNKLYDSTKMLADISAGVGVDMNRLVLAYGQVAAANYLRGTELRQFSEAGVNVLGELANYFTELKGRVIEVDEVFEMVSRRMVRFEDVDAVLRRMTLSGGEFYNMQAVQAQTLKGQISNLKDSIEIMLNDIGTSTEGILKGSVALVREFAENWRHVANALTNVGIVIGTISIASFFKSINEGALSVTKLGKAMAFLGDGWKNITKIMSGARGVFFGVGGAIAILVSTIWRLKKASDALNKKYDDISVRTSRQIQEIQKQTDNYNNATEAVKALNEQISKLESEGKTETEAYTKAVEDLNNAKKKQSKAINILKRDFPDLYKTLEKNTDGTYNLTKAVEAYNQALRTKIMLEQSSKGNWFQGYEDVQTNTKDALEEFGEARNDAAKTYVKIDEKITEWERALGNATNERARERISGIIKELTEVRKFISDPNFEKDFEKLNDLVLSDVAQASIGGAIKDLYKSYKDAYDETNADLLGTNYDKMINGIKLSWDTLKKNTDLASDAGKEQALSFLNEMYSYFGVEDPTLQRLLKEKLEKDLNYTFEEVSKDGNGEGGISAWREAVIDELTEVYNTIPKLTDKVTQELMKVTDEEGNNVLDGFKVALPSESADYYEYIREFQLAWDKVLDLQERAHGKDQRLFSDEARATIDKTVGAYNEMAGIMGLVKDKTKSADEIYSEQIRVLKELHKSYIDLNDIFDKTTSKQGAVEKFGKAFKEAFNIDVDTFWEDLKGINENGNEYQLDFTSEEGITKAFDKVINRIPDEAKRIQAQLAKAEFVMEYRIQAKKDADQQLKGDVQKFFDDYEMKIELDKLGISGDAANTLFGIESMDLDKLREKLTLKAGEFIGRGMEKEYKAFQDKLTEMEVKAQQERLKKYLGNIRDNISDRAKLKIEELQKLKEIEDSFVAKEGASEEEKQAIETAKKLAIEGLKESTKQQLQKMDWDDFQKSDYFISMFDDLDNASSMAINSMITQLENYKDQWTDMPLDDMKKVIDLINKLKDAADEKITNPFYYAKKLNKDIASDGRSKSQAESDFKSYTQTAEDADEQVRLYEQVLIAKTKILDIEQQKLMLGKGNLWLLELSDDEIKDMLETEKNISKQNKTNASLAQQQLQRYAKLTNQYEKQAQVLADIRGTFNNLVGGATELGEALGMDEMSKMWTEIGGNVFDTGLAIAEGILGLKAQKLALDENATAAEEFGYKMNMALGIIGYIVMAIQLVAKVITAINEAHDNKLQKQIERDAEAVELLQKRYEKLEKAIDNAMSFGQYQKEFDEAKRNLEEQIRLTRDMIALEEAKKKTDKDAIKGYKDEIEDYNEQLLEMEQKRIEDMGGFGSEEAVKDAAESFIDAWMSAYKETGDGLSALKEQWNEYFDNLVKKQMVMKVASKYIEQALKSIDDALVGDNMISAEEMANIKQVAEDTSVNLNNILKQFAEQIGYDGGLGSGNLEGLSKSIQGVTEVTAQALEAILNSMRFYVIDSNSQQKRMVEIMESWETPTSPILSELRNQTNYLSDIYGLLNDVVRGNKSFSVV